MAVGGAVGQAAAGGRRVRVSAGPSEIAGALAGVGVPARAAARAPLHRATVRAAMREAAAGAAGALRRARVRVRVLLLRAPRRQLPVHHDVVARRLQQPRA